MGYIRNRAAGLSITHNRDGVHNYILDGPVMELWAWLRGVTPRGYVLVMDYGAQERCRVGGSVIGYGLWSPG